MKSSKELFDLINSLDKAEKRNFKLYLARYDRKKESNESILFDILNKLKKLDEEKIKTQFHTKTKHKSIAFVKNKLMTSLLNFLADYHINVKAILGKILIQISILRKKKQIALALKLIEKGLKLAHEIHNHAYVFILLEAQLSLIFHDIHFNELQFNEVANNINKTIKNVQTDFKYSLLNKTLVAYNNNLFKLPAQKVELKINQLTNTNYWNDETQADTFLSQSFLNDSKALYYYSKNEHEKTISYYKKITERFKSEQAYIRNEPLVYISYIFNYITLLSAHEKYEEAFQEIEKIVQFQSNPKIQLQTLEKKGFKIIYYTTYTDLLVKSDKFEELNIFLKKEKNNIEKIMEENETRRLSYYCFAAINNIIVGNYKELNDFILKFENNISYSTGPRVFTLKIMGLIAHYELKNIQLLHSKFNALYYWSRKQKANPLDHLLIKLFRAINNNIHSTKKQEYGKDILKQMNSLSITDLLYYKGIKHWIENKTL